MVKRAIFGLLILVSVIYLGDLAVLRFRKDPMAMVTVHPYTSVPRNDKKEELIFEEPRDESCVNALFPHQQMPPCWYLRRHPQKETTL